MRRDRYITYDGERFTTHTPDHTPTLDEMQAVVGGWIEPLFTEDFGEIEVTGYVNEEGLLIGLPLNSIFCLTEDGMTKVQLAGNLLIIGLDREGETVLLTEAEAHAVLHDRRHETAILDLRPLRPPTVES